MSFLLLQCSRLFASFVLSSYSPNFVNSHSSLPWIVVFCLFTTMHKRFIPFLRSDFVFQALVGGGLCYTNSRSVALIVFVIKNIRLSLHPNYLFSLMFLSFMISFVLQVFSGNVRGWARPPFDGGHWWWEWYVACPPSLKNSRYHHSEFHQNFNFLTTSIESTLFVFSNLVQCLVSSR